MTRFLLISLGLGLLVSACGGSAGSSSDSEPVAQEKVGAAEPLATPDPPPTEPAEPQPPPKPAPTEPPDEPPIEEVSATLDAEEAAAILRGNGVPVEDWATDFSRHTVPLEEFFSGGPRRDQIPPLDQPKFDTVEAASGTLEPREPVVEVVIGDDARAYPLRVMIWHEIVNDVVGGQPVTVTFCPLCNTAIAFDRNLNGQLLDFGVSGNLRNADLVMWDRQTETWWQQFGGEGVVGELAGEKLTQVPARITAWEDFAARFPDGRVLSQDTGFDRPYGLNPYEGYDSVDSPPFFPAANLDDDRLLPKERVVFVDGENAVVIPFSALEAAGTIEFTADGEALVAEWVPGVQSALDSQAIGSSDEVGSARVTSAATGQLASFDTPFWFAVAAFRPDAAIITG